MRNSDKEGEREVHVLRFAEYSRCLGAGLVRAAPTGSGGRASSSRSSIVEIALRIAPEELNAKGARSRLASRVVDRTETDSGGAAPKVAPSPTRRA